MCPSPIHHLLKIRRPIDQARRSFLLSLLHRFSAPPSLANAIRFLQRRHPGSDTAGIKTMGRRSSRRDNITISRLPRPASQAVGSRPATTLDTQQIHDQEPPRTAKNQHRTRHTNEDQKHKTRHGIPYNIANR